ncbi:MAG: endonuclease/exonuclease/phosphatase family protein [Alphaproteobacteria bacterium]|nr:endonuclease/exonuclease/phosphatase family protein [Alphaproteobacteria bacterium]
MTYNIHYGVGTDGDVDLSRIVDIVKDADIVALQEVDRYWDRTGNVDQLSFIQAKMPDHFVAWGPNVDLHKDATGSRGRLAGSRRQFGNLILSRFPILSIRNHLLPRYGASRLMDMQRGALEAVVEAPGGALRIYCTHLCYLSELQRIAQVKKLLEIHAACAAEGPVFSGHHLTDPIWSAEPGPSSMPADAVLLGDFNIQPDSDAYKMLVGDISARFGPMARHGFFVDAWHVWRSQRTSGGEADPGDGITRYDPPGSRSGRRVDYCFLSEQLVDRVSGAAVLADADASDHQPLFVTLTEPLEP